MSEGYLNRINVITGHYGSGKTNIAVSLALDLKKRHEKVILIDLDIVNPYFRAKDSMEFLESKGITVIAPEFANTNLDAPYLPARVLTAFADTQAYTVFDVGGDDSGAVALGQYRKHFERLGYAMFYVVNKRRFLTRTCEETLELMRSIEAVSGLKTTYLVNNTNLGDETETSTILDSLDFMRRISNASGLPVAFTTVRADLAKSLEGKCDNLFPIEIHTKRYW